VIYDECEEGGFKQSGLGRMNGIAVIDDFIEYKHVTLSHGAVAKVTTCHEIQAPRLCARYCFSESHEGT